MSFLFKLTIAILIVFAILFPILISSDNKLSALFWKIPKDFWVFLIIMYGAIITVVFIESSEQARIRRQQYLQQYKMPNEIHENVVIKNSIISRETTDDESDINTLYLDSFKSKNNCKSFETNSNLLDKCVFRSIRSRIGIEVRSAIRIHSINRELNFFYRFLTRFFAAFHYRGIFPQ
ncbi:TPA: pili assembly chaperone [Escherichia coli]